MPFSDLHARVVEIRARIAHAVARGGHGQEVSIVAVTKTFGPEAVHAAFDVGIADIGENKVQEALGKQAAVTLPLRWHLIGHLQRNKVKALDHFHLLHALDGARLADAIAAWAHARGAPVRVLLQVNVVGEETKGGYALSEVEREGDRLRGLGGLSVIGAMTMAPYGAPETVLRGCFAGARRARDLLAAAGHPAAELSMPT